MFQVLADLISCPKARDSSIPSVISHGSAKLEARKRSFYRASTPGDSMAGYSWRVGAHIHQRAWRGKSRGFFYEPALRNAGIRCRGHTPDRLVNIHENIRLINDFLADKLLNHIFQSHHTQSATILTRIFRNHNHMRLPLLEEVHDIQTARFGPCFR
jgi:hypothetical protein